MACSCSQNQFPPTRRNGTCEGDRLEGMDFAAHNAEQKAMWDAFNAGRPTRIPIILGTNTRYFMFGPANPQGLDFQAFSENPDVMFDAALRFARWSRFNLLQDAELGLPEKWIIAPDFQNYYEAAWFGCPIHYMEDQVPDTTPAFADVPERVMEQGLPDPFGGIFQKVLRYFQHYQQRAAKETFLDRPINANLPWCTQGTDGPMTVACNLFGADLVCEMLAGEPDRIAKLLDFITTATIARIKAWRKFNRIPVINQWGIADDSVALISTPMYREHILPLHRRLFNELAAKEKRGIHLCGDATRHFKLIHDELGVVEFDTGFPVDFGKLRQQLGPHVRINGGPHVEFLMHATPAQVRDEVQRILSTGILDGGLFVLREGNNLAPYTPLENTEALYHAGREFGKIGAAAVS